MSFDMEGFLKELRQSHELTDVELLAATLHHCWEDHPFRIETSIHLIAISSELVIDMADVQYIKRNSKGDFYIAFKSDGTTLSIFQDTPEFEALIAIIALMNREH